MTTEREEARLKFIDVGIEDHGCLWLDAQFEGDGWGQGIGRLFNDKCMGRLIEAVLHLFSGGYGMLRQIKNAPCYIVRETDACGHIVRIEPFRKSEGRALDFREDNPDWFMNSRRAK